MPIVIRLAEAGDIPSLEKLIPASARALQAAYYSRVQIEGALGPVFGVDRQLIRDGTYYVAEAEGKIVGCGGWSRRKTLFGGDAAKTADDPELDPKVDPARIRAFFVDPGWVRRGIGRKIMELSEAAAIAAGFHRIDIVATLAGEPLYLRFGYREVERYSIPLPGAGSLPVVRLSKTMSASPPSPALPAPATDLTAVFARIDALWEPVIAGELNGQHVKCAKLKGEFIWHRHEAEDELFLVHRGVLQMRLRDRTVTIGPGQFFIVPRGTEHQPYAPDLVEVVLFEPASTLNTGNVQNKLTKTHLKRLDG